MVVLLLAELLVAFTRTTWIGFLGYTPEWANAGLYIASPLIAGIAAFVTRSYVTDDFIAVTGARRVTAASKVIVSAWARVVILALLAHALVMLTLIVVTLVFGASGAVHWEPFVYAVMPILMAAAIGTSLAAILPSLWSSAIAVVATYGIWYLLVINEAAVPVNIGGATIGLAGLSYDPIILAIMGLSAILVTALFLVVGVLAIRSRSLSRALWPFAAVAFAVILVGTIVGTQVGNAKFVSSGAPEFRCAGSAPQVCLTTDHDARLGEVAAGVDSVAGLLRDAGVDMTDVTLTETLVDSQPGEDGTLLMQFGQLNTIGTSREDYAQALLRPTTCAEYYTDKPTDALDRLFDGAGVVGQWLDAKMNDAETSITNAQVKALYTGLQECVIDSDILQSVPTS